MEFPIGVNAADVVEEGERIYGDGVNIAAQMEGLSEGEGKRKTLVDLGLNSVADDLEKIGKLG